MRVTTRAQGATERWYARAASRSRDNGRAIRAWWTADEPGQRFLREWLPLILVVGATVAYLVIFERLSYLRHDHFGSFDYDLGMYDQGIWQLAHGRGFMTIRGMHVFGHHANLGYLLFVPFYWLGAGPQFLQFVNTLGVTMVALPVYLLGRFHMRSRWAGFWLVIAYLFHFSPQWKIQETFHPESIAAPLIVGAFYLATRGRWKGYWWCVFLALIWKEDVALVIVVMGLLVAFMFKDRWRGLLTTVIGAAWFVVATKFFMPLFQQSGAVFDNLFGPLGANMNQVVWNSIRDPSRLGQALHDHKAEQGAYDLMKPYGFTGIVSPHVLALGVPQHVVNFASIQNFTWDLRWHYAFFPYIAVLLASIRTVVTRSRTWLCWALIGVMVVGVWVTRDEGIGPWSNQYRLGFWALDDSPRNQDIRAMMKEIPDDAHVTTNYFIVPHLSHRQYIYTFPNPWKASNYGFEGVPKPPSPKTIDVLFVDEDALCPSGQVPSDDCQLYREVTSSGDWVVADRRGQMVLWKQRR